VAPVGADGVVSEREAAGPAPVQSPLTLFASMISPSTTLEHTMLDGPNNDRRGYIHVAQTSGYNTEAATGARIRITGDNGTELELKEGDGAYVYAEAGKKLRVENIGDKVSEVLFFDMD
jgi:hypothetical protein